MELGLNSPTILDLNPRDLKPWEPYKTLLFSGLIPYLADTYRGLIIDEHPNGLILQKIFSTILVIPILNNRITERLNYWHKQPNGLK